MKFSKILNNKYREVKVTLERKERGGWGIIGMDISQCKIKIIHESGFKEDDKIICFGLDLALKKLSRRYGIFQNVYVNQNNGKVNAIVTFYCPDLK